MIAPTTIGAGTALAAFGINGVGRNIDGWCDAFGIKRGDSLYLDPGERARIGNKPTSAS